MLGYFYASGDIRVIVGLEGASVHRLDWPCRRSVSNGDEFNKAAPVQQAPPPAPAAPGPATGENGAQRLAPPTSIPRLRPVRVPKLALCRERRLLSQAVASDEK